MSLKCTNCRIRVPQNRPMLTCSICRDFKHYKCNNLSKNEAFALIANGHMGYWACQDCMVSLFPATIDDETINTVTSHDYNNTKYTTMQCGACNKPCSPLLTDNFNNTCNWCDRPCHKKCLKNSLGCIACCNSIIPGYNYDSYQLTNSLLSNNNRIVFAPYDHTSLTNQIGESIDAEGEGPVWAEIADQMKKCKYTEAKNIQTAKNNELKIMSLNIRSLSKSIGHIRENIIEFNKFDILCFCETNCNVDTLPNGVNDILIDGFYCPYTINPHRDSNKGGGLAIYVNHRVCDEQDLEVLDLGLDSPSSSACEYMFLKVNIKLANSNHKKTYIIGNFYRSPSTKPSHFLDKLENILSKLDRHRHKQIILTGDLNIDLVKHEHEPNSQLLIDMTTRNGFIQVINRPTRVTDHSATLIDHIFTNQIHNMLSSGIITYDISDHLGIYITIALQDNIGIKHNIDGSTSPFSKFNAENLANFQNLIKNETWEGILDEPDTQAKYDKFIKIYTGHYETAFPKTNSARRKKQRKNPKPWILPWLEEACDRKNKLYHAYVKDPITTNKIRYDKMKKFVAKHIRLAKNKYYKTYFEQYSSNSRKQWQLLNSLLNRQKSKTTTTKLQDDNGTVISNPADVAEQFNNYFSTIAEKLKEQIHNNTNPLGPTHSYQSHLKDPVVNSIYLQPSHPGEITETINSLKLKTTSDTNIGALKAAAEVPSFNGILSNIINSSFAQGVFPSQLKVAKVIPIHKSGRKTDVSNYRPISLLSAFSKIFEKIMHTRVYNFLQCNNALNDMQYGFRKQRSCEHALLVAQNELLSALNKKQIALLLLIDFSKAFDMVNHDILLHKLSHYGIRGIANEWFKSYLRDREQFVSISGQHSTKQKLKYSVPQGSILGPLLFIIYINDMPNINALAKFILYADDANIIITGNSLFEIEVIFNELSRALVNWVSHNELLLNIKKTNYMIFTRKRSIDMGIFTPKIGNISIERKPVARFLGVLVDEKLSWTYHIAAVKSKMSRYIGVLYKLKHILPLSARMLSFNSLVQSHINYCSLVWGACSNSKIESLFTTQKKAMRAVMPGWVNYFYKEGVCPSHTKSSFTKLNVLTVHNVILKNAMIFMNKVHNYPHLLPTSVLQTISPDSPSPDSNTDYSTDWYSKYNSIPYNNSIFFKAPLLYTNIMSNNILNNYSTNTYKTSLKAYILGIQSSENEEEWSPVNFKLNNIPGLRKSNRIKLQSVVDYTA